MGDNDKMFGTKKKTTCFLRLSEKKSPHIGWLKTIIISCSGSYKSETKVSIGSVPPCKSPEGKSSFSLAVSGVSRPLLAAFIPSFVTSPLQSTPIIDSRAPVNSGNFILRYLASYI